MRLDALPRMARPHAALELSVWGLMAIPAGILSGGVTGVLANRLFDGTVPGWLLAGAVAVLTGAGALANLASVFWANWNSGRPKIPAARSLQLALVFVLLTGSLIPVAPAGLLLLVTVVVSAQLLWCGIITIRATIWRRNYSRTPRTQFAARNQIVVSLTSAAAAALAGWFLGRADGDFRIVFVVAAAATALSWYRFRSMRIRRERQLLADEPGSGDGGRFSPQRYLQILTGDRPYRRYMICMMILGSGNLMFTAPLILIMENQLRLPGFEQILIAAALPTVVAPLATPFWARLLARHHVIWFRARNSIFYALGIALLIAGSLSGSAAWLYAASIVFGIGIGGGTLGWNLGHNDFASDARVAEYAGIHVSLTGIRGLLAPIVGVAVYGLLERAAPGAGRYALFLPLALTGSGVAGFWWLRRQQDRSQARSAKTG